jgi:cysteine-rich repeat protein
MTHRWLIAVSMTAHISVAAGLFVAGAWNLERLHADKLHIDIRDPVRPPPAPPAGISAAVHVDVPHPHITHAHVQPVAHLEQQPTATGIEAGVPGEGSGTPDATGPCTENCGDPAPPTPPVCGNGSVETGEQCDDGNTQSGDGCSATCQLEPRPRPQTMTIAPNLLQAQRISGTTQVHPDEVTQQQMAHDGVTRTVASFKLCVSPAGDVAMTQPLKSSGYAAYDRDLRAAMASWRYQPFVANGQAITACSVVSFVYSVQ